MLYVDHTAIGGVGDMGEEGMERNVNSTFPIIPKHYLQVSNEQAD